MNTEISHKFRFTVSTNFQTFNLKWKHWTKTKVNDDRQNVHMSVCYVLKLAAAAKLKGILIWEMDQEMFWETEEKTVKYSIKRICWFGGKSFSMIYIWIQILNNFVTLKCNSSECLVLVLSWSLHPFVVVVNRNIFPWFSGFCTQTKTYIEIETLFNRITHDKILLIFLFHIEFGMSLCFIFQ